MGLEQHEKVQEYLNAVCSQIKCREVHGQIRLELLGHIEERVEELKLANVPEGEAVDKAIGQMGEAFSLGKQLHQAHKPRIEWGLLVLIGSFVGIGLLTLLSITTVIRMAGVAMQVKEQYGRLLVVGLTSIFAIQFFWNILMTLGFAPISGFNLPFVSYGGSQLIIQLAAMGLILSVYRRKDMVAIYK